MGNREVMIALLAVASCMSLSHAQPFGPRTRWNRGAAWVGTYAGDSSAAGGAPDFPISPEAFQEALLQQFNAHAAMVASHIAQTAGHWRGPPGFAFYGFVSPNPPFIQSNFFPKNFFQWAGANDVGGGGSGVGASAVGSSGPDGVHGYASVYPGPGGEPAIDVRFGDGGGGGGGGDFMSGPPAGGRPFGVFSSSSSGQSSIDGKTTGYKTATVGFNDNGKVTSYTVHDP